MANQTKLGISKELKQGSVSLLLGGGVTIASFYLCAVLIVRQTLAQSTFLFLATGAICLGCFSSGLVLAWQRKKRGLLCGAICFAVFTIILLSGGWLSGTREVSSIALMRFVLLGISACLGGCIGVAKAEQHVKRHRKKI